MSKFSKISGQWTIWRFCCKITCFLILLNSRPGPKKTLSSGNSQIGVQMDICYCSSSSYRGTLLALSHTPPSPILRQKYAQTFYHKFCNVPTKIYIQGDFFNFPFPPPLMAQISIHFLPHFFSFAIESYIYETDFTLGLSPKYRFWVFL